MVDILIVEDNEELSGLLCEFLRAEDYTVSTAPTAEKALSLFEKYGARLVLLDIMLPDMDGFAVCRRIRERDNTPMIMLTARTDKEDKLSGIVLGADDYIEKPAEKTRIFKVMDDVLMKKSEYDTTPRLMFTSDRCDYSVPYPDIISVSTVMRNYLEITQSPDKTYRVRLPFSGIQDELSADKRFFTITRGVMVNMDYVKGIEGNVCVLANEERFPITSNNVDNFKNIWQNYQIDSLRNERKRRHRGK